MRSLFLIIAVNFAFIITLWIITYLLGLGSYTFFDQSGNIQFAYKKLAYLCLLYGFGASFFSLWTSKFFAKLLYRVSIITNPNGYEKRLVERVNFYASKAGLKKMPSIGIYPQDDVNAFATGRSRNNSLVALSQGLLRNLNDQEIDGVIAHEVAHIANGDMVTMTLLQGLVNSIVMFFSSIISSLITSRSRDSISSWWVRSAVYFVVSSILMTFGMIIVCKFSRSREFRADRGGAMLAGKATMLAALRKLYSYQQSKEALYSRRTKEDLYSRRSYPHSSSSSRNMGNSISCLKISSDSPTTRRFRDLWATHPPLEDRIAEVEKMASL